MAYTREQQETVDFAFPLSEVWASIPEALANLGWEIEKTDEEAHMIKAKTKQSIISWGTTMVINAEAADEKTTTIKISAETPVTTITSVFNFGQTGQRIELFFKELLKQLKNPK